MFSPVNPLSGSFWPTKMTEEPSAALRLHRAHFVEDAKRFLESLDLLLAHCDPLRVTHACVDTRFVQLLQLLDCLIEQILVVEQRGHVVGKAVESLRQRLVLSVPGNIFLSLTKP